jgi:hypothetical protein
MRTIINGKRLQICFLLCSFLFFEYFNYGFFSSARDISSEMNVVAASLSGTGQHSSMSNKIYTGLDSMGAVNNYANIYSAGKSRELNLKNNFSFLSVLSASHTAVLINYLRWSGEIYNQFDSIKITTFLHKKDGMK